MADNLNYSYGITINLGAAGAIAGTTSSFTSTANTQCVINGKFATPLPLGANVASPVLDAATGRAFNALAPNQCCTLVWGVSSAGALQLVQGNIIPTSVGLAGVPGPLINDPQFPGLPNDFCPIAYTVVRTAPSAVPWAPGSGAWTAAGVVASVFQNIAQIPNRPQAS